MSRPLYTCCNGEFCKDSMNRLLILGPHGGSHGTMCLIKMHALIKDSQNNSDDKRQCLLLLVAWVVETVLHDTSACRQIVSETTEREMKAGSIYAKRQLG